MTQWVLLMYIQPHPLALDDPDQCENDTSNSNSTCECPEGNDCMIICTDEVRDSHTVRYLGVQ